MRRYARLLLAFSSFLLFFPNAAAAEDISEACKSCHEDVFRRAISSPFQHTVARDKCVICHSSNPAVLSNGGGEENILTITSRTLNREEVFPLKALEEDIEHRIEIVAIDNGGRKSDPKFLAIKPLDVDEGAISPVKDIRGLMIEEVEHGIFVRASLFWLTGAPATSEVEYGLTRDFENRMTVDDHYTKEHRIPITGLIRDRRYYFRAVSKDLFGNITRSEELTLDTSLSFSGSAESMDTTAVIPVIYDTEVFKVETQGVYLSVSLNKPSRIQLKISAEGGNKREFVHSFPQKVYSTITVCISCHKQGASHPVGVRARKPGIITPYDLPTIEGGILTCVTCHDPHGSDRQYLARVDFKRNICIKCHVSDTFI